MTLSEARKEIDKIDEEIVNLLLRRQTLSRCIGEIKLRNNIPVVDAAREEEIFNKLKLTLKSEYEYIEPIFREILRVSKTAQKSLL